MRALAGSGQRGSFVACGVMVGAIAAVVFSAVTAANTPVVVMGCAGAVVAAVVHQRLLRWDVLLSVLLAFILFMPIRRYTFPGNLPFELEPYRLLTAAVAAGWLASLLVDWRVRLRPTGLRGPLFLISFAYLASVAANGELIHDLGVGEQVAKSLMFFASFVLLLFLIVSVVRSQRTLHLLIQLLVAGGALLAALALFETATGNNPFNRLGDVVPLLELQPLPFSLEDVRGDRLRAYASAEHPIALSAVFVMLIPLAVYLTRATGQRRWWLAAGLLLIGTMSTVSRTGIVMLLVVGAVFFWLRRAETKRFLPLLLPALVAVQIALPGTLGALHNAFFPEGGIVASEQEGANTGGSGRLADVGPTLSEWSQRPLFGQGYGTRVVSGEEPNARILDDQWLASLLETGILGVAGWFWLFRRSVRRLGRAAEMDDSPRGWLYTALAASILSFAVGMLTYDAFSFIQSTVVLFVLLAFATVALRQAPEADLSRTARVTRREAHAA